MVECQPMPASAPHPIPRWPALRAGLVGATASVWLVLSGPLPAIAAPACPPPQAPVQTLRALAEARWQLADPAAREPLALALLPCLASPDPELRDTLAFTALSTWLRGEALSADAARRLGAHALQVLAAPDGQGFDAPFAALLLAEVARVDRQRPLWSQAEREQVLGVAERYLSLTRDYRGFDPVHGWRHAVAHGADLMMQLALNPALGRPELDRIRAAVAAQVAPSTHFYIFGESERLMRPVVFMARRGLHEADEWKTWMTELAAAARGAPGAAPDMATLARQHNTKAFLLALHALLHEADDAVLRERLLPAVSATLRALLP